MKKPILLIVDDDEQVLRAVVRDVRTAYGKDYRIISTASANEALASLTDLKNKGEVVAMFLSDQRMPDMLGVDFLQKARLIFPNAKRVLLTAYSDTEAAIRAINDVQLDYYLMKPWDRRKRNCFRRLPIYSIHGRVITRRHSMVFASLDTNGRRGRTM